MWIISGNGMEMINADRVTRFFINHVADVWLIGATYDGSDKVMSIGKYDTEAFARQTLTAIAAAMSDDAAYYIAPDNHIDAPTPRKIMDSRVKRKGGS